MDAPLRSAEFITTRRSPAQRFRRLTPIARVALFLGGCLLVSVAWCCLLFLLFRPGADVWAEPWRYPWAYNLYLAGTYSILLGGAVWTWRRMQGETLAALGVTGQPRWPAWLAAGAACGTASLGLLFALEVSSGILHWQSAAWAATPATVIGLNALTALFFGASEEVLFRGFVLQTLRRGLGTVWAVVGSAWLYATVHFLRFDLHWAQVVTPFTGLFLAGLLLGWTVLRTRSIWFAIGLHSAWVYLFFLSDRQRLFGYPPDFNWLTGGGYPLGGLFGIALILVLWTALYMKLPRPAVRRR